MVAFSQILAIFGSGFVIGVSATVAGIIYLKRWANRKPKGN